MRVPNPCSCCNSPENKSTQAAQQHNAGRRRAVDREIIETVKGTRAQRHKKRIRNDRNDGPNDCAPCGSQHKALAQDEIGRHSEKCCRDIGPGGSEN